MLLNYNHPFGCCKTTRSLHTDFYFYRQMDGSFPALVFYVFVYM